MSALGKYITTAPHTQKKTLCIPPHKVIQTLCMPTHKVNANQNLLILQLCLWNIFHGIVNTPGNSARITKHKKIDTNGHGVVISTDSSNP
jgi:hypothetical protein